jgi:predicted Zn finger-like uncharacterized protein
MIIQCKACKTKYRFDETVITGDGVWVRCSRCQNLFFQMPLPETDERRDADEPMPPVDKTPPFEREMLPESIEEDIPEDESEKKSNAFIWVMGFLLVILIAIGGGLFLFPQGGDVIIKKISTIFPAAEGFLRGSPPVPAVGPAQVKMVDLKQRFVENAMMGTIRVVEGMAMNTSSVPMTRIKVRAELYDVLGTPVRQGVSYCGNLLTDQELKAATEEQIAAKLALPQGTDISNERIAPNSMIPFMIVFLREPPGVTKTMVMPIEAERLLP